MKRIIYIICFISSAALHAQDRLFTYTYQSGVLNRGQREIEIWNTFRTGRTDLYSRLDNRTEFEVGLGHNLQTAFYLNISSLTQSVDDNGTKALETENEISFSNEWKLKLTDPVANPIGIALYGEYGIGTREYELEGKLILDKSFNKITIASNLMYELELKAETNAMEIEWEKEHKADINLAFAYVFSPKFALTIENTYRNVIKNGIFEHSALNSGPGFSYSQENFWINFTALPQIKSFKGQAAGNSLNLNEFEKVQLRLLFSYAF
ncbi:MAG: hypothetical protein H6540_03485 [Bacteroidales bacterium]|nr:hypothetical protein [Bacteroidales bacterium]